MMLDLNEDIDLTNNTTSMNTKTNTTSTNNNINNSTDNNINSSTNSNNSTTNSKNNINNSNITSSSDFMKQLDGIDFSSIYNTNGNIFRNDLGGSSIASITDINARSSSLSLPVTQTNWIDSPRLEIFKADTNKMNNTTSPPIYSKFNSPNINRTPTGSIINNFNINISNNEFNQTSNSVSIATPVKKMGKDLSLSNNMNIATGVNNMGNLDKSSPNLNNILNIGNMNVLSPSGSVQGIVLDESFGKVNVGNNQSNITRTANSVQNDNMNIISPNLTKDEKSKQYSNVQADSDTQLKMRQLQQLQYLQRNVHMQQLALQQLRLPTGNRSFTPQTNFNPFQQNAQMNYVEKMTNKQPYYQAQMFGSNSVQSTNYPTTTTVQSSNHSIKNQSKKRDSKKKKRTYLTREQFTKLETYFKHTKCPSRQHKEKLSQEFGLSLQKIDKWFSNRRSKYRKLENADDPYFKYWVIPTDDLRGMCKDRDIDLFSKDNKRIRKEDLIKKLIKYDKEQAKKGKKGNNDNNTNQSHVLPQENSISGLRVDNTQKGMITRHRKRKSSGDLRNMEQAKRFKLNKLETIERSRRESGDKETF